MESALNADDDIWLFSWQRHYFTAADEFEPSIRPFQFVNSHVAYFHAWKVAATESSLDNEFAKQNPMGKRFFTIFTFSPHNVSLSVCLFVLFFFFLPCFQ